MRRFVWLFVYVLFCLLPVGLAIGQTKLRGVSS